MISPGIALYKHRLLWCIGRQKLSECFHPRHVWGPCIERPPSRPLLLIGISWWEHEIGIQSAYLISIECEAAMDWMNRFFSFLKVVVRWPIPQKTDRSLSIEGVCGHIVTNHHAFCEIVVVQVEKQMNFALFWGPVQIFVCLLVPCYHLNKSLISTAIPAWLAWRLKKNPTLNALPVSN